MVSYGTFWLQLKTWLNLALERDITLKMTDISAPLRMFHTKICSFYSSANGVKFGSVPFCLSFNAMK